MKKSKILLGLTLIMMTLPLTSTWAQEAKVELVRRAYCLSNTIDKTAKAQAKSQEFLASLAVQHGVNEALIGDCDAETVKAAQKLSKTVSNAYKAYFSEELLNAAQEEDNDVQATGGGWGNFIRETLEWLAKKFGDDAASGAKTVTIKATPKGVTRQAADGSWLRSNGDGSWTRIPKITKPNPAEVPKDI